ncbi:MAG TPA: hypothetical protein VNF46_04740, partial [Gammaproteobacteria bacterium]|nr:hypothetical protein [Gammaproteobacteria bacterium]
MDRCSTLSSSRAPSEISRRPRLTVAEVPFQAGVPGAVSGRQRRQGRNPASAAAAPGSLAQDPIGYDPAARRFTRAGNHAGGLEGGMTNG